MPPERAPPWRGWRCSDGPRPAFLAASVPPFSPAITPVVTAFVAAIISAAVIPAAIATFAVFGKGGTLRQGDAACQQEPKQITPGNHGPSLILRILSKMKLTGP